MKSTSILAFAVATLLNMQFSIAGSQDEAVRNLKDQIVSLAASYEGQGDPDQSKQKTIDVLVEMLVKENPMPPVSERISILAGAWKQIWGPYDYRNDVGGVDPKIGINEIYQVISADGYYYNVSPLYPDEDRRREQIGLLRGEFKLDPNDINGLRVQFTKYPGVEPRPHGTNIWELAERAEMNSLENEITIVPTWVVRLFFGRGKLEEVYTDADLRIVYGSNGKRNARRSIYVMRRVGQ